MPDRENAGPRVNPLPRKERERLQREREILEAAERVFSRRGFFAAQVSEIAKEAEFAVGTLYSFFKSKEDIYRRLVEEKFRECIAKYKQAAESADGDPRLQIERLIEAKVEYFLDNKAFFRIYVTEFRGMGHSLQRELRGELASLYDEYLLWLSDIFRDGVRAGIFVEMDPDALSTALEAVSNSALVRYLRSGQEASPSQMTDAIRKILFEGILVSRRAS
ncbi:MAG: hypothetical protein Kow0099_09260 [Candidatus Abyssubacteria bacterium]